MFNKPRRSFRKSPGGSADIRAYKRYRKDGMELNHKIMGATLDKGAISHAAGALGMAGQNRMLILDSESELSVLMDYALYECRSQGKNAVERYQEQVGGKSRIEQELLTAMVASSTSLFKAVSVSKEMCTIRLNDLVNEGHTITLIDINFSQSVKPGWLLFVRPVTFENFSMTSGIAFLFPGDLEDELLAQWRRIQSRRGRSAQPVSARRYATFFKLSKRTGIEVRYE